MTIYYITECPGCKNIQMNSTNNLNKAVMRCRSCYRSKKASNIPIIRKSEDVTFISKLCIEIKREKQRIDELSLSPKEIRKGFKNVL